MITLVLTNRNRDLKIIQRCLDSLARQSETLFKTVLVDYGSDVGQQHTLKDLVAGYDFITLLLCPSQKQLWNKSRAINMALKQCNTSYVLVSDIDLMFHPEFIETAQQLAAPDTLYYFQYGFLNEAESKQDKPYADYEVAFKGNDEVTGTTLFPIDLLKSVNGYDEFYHGWGAEDTDVHIRLKQAGLKCLFYDEVIMVKHQWHAKAYRSKQSRFPYHSNLEQINHAYMQQTQSTGVTVVNLNTDWGVIPDAVAYKTLKQAPDYKMDIVPDAVVLAALQGQCFNLKPGVFRLRIKGVLKKERFKEGVKRVLGRRHKTFVSMEAANNYILELIIHYFRNHPYEYSFDRERSEIILKLVVS